MKIVEVKENEDGDLYIEIPDDILKELRWVENDILIWDINEDGTISLRKKE